MRGKAYGLLVMALLGVFFFTVGGPLLDRCSQMPGSPNLQAGQRVMYQMMGRENLRVVGFFDAYPAAKPSEFVELVSDPEHALWPPKPRPAGDGPSPNYSNRVPWPPGVVFSAGTRQTTDADEIVYVPDDTANKMIIRGYSPGQTELTFEYIWDFPTNAGAVPLN